MAAGLKNKRRWGGPASREERRVTRSYFFFLPAFLAFFLAGFFLAMKNF
jgi:hypothetical protein